MNCITPPAKQKVPACYTDAPKFNFQYGNAKLSKSIATFSLPSGFSCPFAKECLSKADRNTGKMIDGKHCRFRCFTASGEALYPNVRNARWRNFDLAKSFKNEAKLGKVIQDSLPTDTSIVRVHVAGDFYTEKYFVAWLNVALNNPAHLLYGYTKALPYLVKYADEIPTNFRFTASLGGTHDHLIGENGLRYAQVVFTEQEAKDLGFEIDHDDSHAIKGTKSFALLLHGTQPPGTEASKAWQVIKKTVGGYRQGKNPGGRSVKPDFHIYVKGKKFKIKNRS